VARGRVVNEVQELGGLLKVLREHGVSRFQRGLDGALQVEFFVDGSAASLFGELPPEQPMSVAPPPPAPSAGEGGASGEEPVRSEPPRRSLTGLPSTDPLFDGVK